MTKPKTLEQLRTEKERAETQLAQEKQKPSWSLQRCCAATMTQIKTRQIQRSTKLAI